MHPSPRAVHPRTRATSRATEGFSATTAIVMGSRNPLGEFVAPIRREFVIALAEHVVIALDEEVVFGLGVPERRLAPCVADRTVAAEPLLEHPQEHGHLAIDVVEDPHLALAWMQSM